MTGRLTARWLLLALVVFCLGLLPSVPSAGAPAQGSPVSAENALPGTHAWYPLAVSGTAHAVEGYASQASVAVGDTLQLHVSTSPASSYRINIYRLGYYQGLGGRLLACLPSCSTMSQGQAQPISPPDSFGAAAQNWPVTDSITVPPSWISGYYVAKVVSGSRSAPIAFIVRDSRPSGILVVAATNTDAAYNSWGGKSLYTFNSTGGVAAVKVSLDRPTNNPVYFFEHPFVSFAEQHGYDLSYTTDWDVDQTPSSLLNHQLVLVNGHSEYWSKGDRDAYEAARGAGVNLAFWGGDQGTWQVRYEDGGRTMVGYKLKQDPIQDVTTTTSFARPPVNRPECKILGNSFLGGRGYISSYTPTAAGLADPWMVAAGYQAGQTVVGNNFEYDGPPVPPTCLGYPATVLFSAVSPAGYGPATKYTTPWGSTVFSVGSFALSMVGATDPKMQALALTALDALTTSSLPIAPLNTSQPTISGSPVLGQVLTSSPGSWTGSPPPSFTYQWQRCDNSGANCADVAVATGSSYLLSGADVDSTIRVAVTAANTEGAASATSGQTAVVTDGATAPLNTSPPTVSGSAVEGMVLSGSAGVWDGSPVPTFSYQWGRCDTAGASCTAILGATDTSYLLGVVDVGSTIRLEVTASNSVAAALATSAQTAVVVGSGGAIGPTTPVLETFNRANGGAGGNWSLLRPTGYAGMNVSGNAAVDASASAFASNYWNPASFGPDVEAYATVNTLGANDSIRIGARVVNAGTTSASGYYVQISSSGVWSILRVDAGPSTTLSTGPTQPLLAGDKILIRVGGSVISALRYTGGNWAQVMSYDTAADATRYTGTGRILIQFKTSTIDDFGGGTI